MREFSVDSKKLLEIVRVVDLVPSVTGFPSSTFIRLDLSINYRLGLALAAEVCGDVHVKLDVGEIGGPVLFCARSLLFPFLNVAAVTKSEKPFVFTINKGQLRVQQGRRKAVFDCADTGVGYHAAGSLEGKHTVLELSEGVLEAMKVVSSCATADTTVPELNCVYLRRNGSGVEFYGSNQLLAIRMSEKVKAQMPDTLAVPLSLVPHLAAEGIKEILLYEKTFALKFSCGTIWQPISIKAQKGFPHEKIDVLIKTGLKCEKRFSVQAKRFSTIADRFGLYLASAKKDEWLVAIKADEGATEIQMEAKLPQGVFRDRLRVEEPVKKAFVLDWPLDLLLPLFTYLGKQKDCVLDVHFGDDTPYLLTTGKLSIVVDRRK